MHKLGMDIGSTTIKTILLDAQGATCFTDYRRHFGKVHQAFFGQIEQLHETWGRAPFTFALTGSTGMGLSEDYGIPFVQEVIGAATASRALYPDAKAVLDIGGEDSKLLFFHPHNRTDIRMNGNCAGGTGAFIDQMAALMDVPLEHMNTLAEQGEPGHPIASRCGVFAKTDIQNLLSRGVSKADISSSLFRALVTQAANTLMRGYPIKGPILFTGGPFAFFPVLRKMFRDHLGLEESQILSPDSPQLLSAVGAAMHGDAEAWITGADLLLQLKKKPPGHRKNKGLAPLFDSPRHCTQWKTNRFSPAARNLSFKDDGRGWFLGVDSGSTTTKMVLIDHEGRIGPKDYRYNEGEPIKAVQMGLRSLEKQLSEKNGTFNIRCSAVTGYGEDLVSAFFGIGLGFVETLAHVRAARAFSPDVTFILDMGGQDMKAVFIDNNHVRSIEINEACSAGCGSFIHTFSQSLGHSVEEFAEMACLAEAPCRLGSRCTVFMNSRVKQFLKEGRKIEDIAAGLAVSVIDNAVQKVLKIRDPGIMGEHIVVQGGTFLNPAVHRAFEQKVGKKVVCPDIAGFMGAFGAALLARDHVGKNPQAIIGHGRFQTEQVPDVQRKTIRCHGCENTCTVTRLEYSHPKDGKRGVFFSGNRCETVYTNKGKLKKKGFNLVTFKYNLFFNAPRPFHTGPHGRIGIPRVLNMYEVYPFFTTLLTECGFNVILSPPSTMALYELGAGSIMSDSLCFPAKLVHGHIQSLIQQNVDRIFYPMVVYERMEGLEKNSYNCPVVSGYPDVIDSSLNPFGHHGIPLDKPPFTFKDPELLKKNAWDYLNPFNISRKRFERAFRKAMAVQSDTLGEIREKASEILIHNEALGRKTILLIGRPYHDDPLINHKLPDMICDYGMDVISAGAMFSTPVPDGETEDHVFTQWAYTNRLYRAASLAGEFSCVEVVCINSFGCGPDAIAVDEVRDMLRSMGKNLTVIRVDEMVSINSIRLRIRTLLETMKENSGCTFETSKRMTTAPFELEDKRKHLLLPMISRFHTPFVQDVVAGFGYRAAILPETDSVSRDLGLMHTNNEMCYPAILIIGDILKAFKSGTFDPCDSVVGLFQTGGQCRLSSYIALIKKALVSSGYAHVPVIPIVVSVNAAHHRLLKHPVFRLNTMKLIENGFYYMLYCDVLSRMYYSTVSREKNKGESLALVTRYIERGVEEKIKDNKRRIVRLLNQAVSDFNAVPIHNLKSVPKIGVVGEIYVKYNTFSHRGILDWLIEQGVEIDMPPLMYTVFQMLANKKINRHLKLARNDSFWILSPLFEYRAEQLVGQVDRLYQNFRFYKPFHSIRELKASASEIMSLSSQFGEGWMIAAEIMTYAREGNGTVLCLQPFGCIANQVIAKGLEKRIKDIHPDMNILYIDLDFDTSDVNIHNRLHFLIQNAVERHAPDTQPKTGSPAPCDEFKNSSEF